MSARCARPGDDDLLAAVGAPHDRVDPVPPGLVARINAALDTAPTPACDWRALTVKQPWAACIASGQKLTENRTWQTKHRGLLLIHAGAEWDKNATRDALEAHPAPVMDAYHSAPDELNALGAILALAVLDDCHPYEPGCCTSPWAEKSPGTWHWTFGSVRALPAPVPCKGSLSLWRPSPDVLAAVLRQIGGAS